MTTHLYIDDTNTGAQTCILKHNTAQMQSEQKAQCMGLQTQSCGYLLLSREYEKTKDWRLCHEHYKVLRSCGNCEFEELEDNKTTQTIDWMDTKVCTPF